MRTLHHHLILYDAECPMCQLYTSAFTKTGMLDPNGRAPYQTVLDPKNLAPCQTAPGTPTSPACPLIDPQRAVNEIALIDTTTGEVKYGIESLFKVIGHAIPFFKPLFSCRPFLWLMRKVYAFISYNRKVIIPPTSQPTNLTTPQPTFYLKYRLAYLIFTLTIAAAILTRYAHLLSGILPVGNRWREFLICSGQIFFQGIIISLIAPKKGWDYLGNMMTISLAGSLALLPILAISKFAGIPAAAATVWFLLVAAAMLLEHLRRTKLLGLNWTLSITWIIYRLLVLFVITKYLC